MNYGSSFFSLISGGHGRQIIRGTEVTVNKRGRVIKLKAWIRSVNYKNN
jgi:hypothetical protein